MPRPVHHPVREQITLSAVLDALSDPVRQRMVARLAARGELACRAFGDLGSKANLTYHFARLREAGLVGVRLEGSFRYVSLRTGDLRALFPGLLPAVLAGVRREEGQPPGAGSAGRARRGRKATREEEP